MQKWSKLRDEVRKDPERARRVDEIKRRMRKATERTERRRKAE